MRYDVTASCSERRKKNMQFFSKFLLLKFVLVAFDFECNFRTI